MANIETRFAIEKVFKISWMRLLLIPPVFVLANFERTSALIFSALGTCRISDMSTFPIKSLTLAKYLYSIGSFAWYDPDTCDVTIWESLQIIILVAPTSEASSRLVIKA